MRHEIHAFILQEKVAQHAAAVCREQAADNRADNIEPPIACKHSARDHAHNNSEIIDERRDNAAAGNNSLGKPYDQFVHCPSKNKHVAKQDTPFGILAFAQRYIQPANATGGPLRQAHLMHGAEIRTQNRRRQESHRGHRRTAAPAA